MVALLNEKPLGTLDYLASLLEIDQQSASHERNSIPQ